MRGEKAGLPLSGKQPIFHSHRWHKNLWLCAFNKNIPNAILKYLCIHTWRKVYSQHIQRETNPDKQAQTMSESPIIYQIRIEGHLGSQWTDWFNGLTITLEEDGHTLITGPVTDQAALHGLLKKVRDLGLPLVSVNPVEPGPSTTLPLRGLRWAGQADQSDVK
jgi:hypothetical protein